MAHSGQFVTDREGHSYRIEVEERDHCLDIWLLDHRTEIGRAACILHPDAMELTDIIIWEKPVLFRKGLWRLVPYDLYVRLKGKNYRQRGLGTELLKTIIAKAREKGVVCIRGFVTNQGIAENPKLLEWYQKHDFTVMPVTSPGSEKTDKVAQIQMDLK
jgi:GNAT superfamily N-acetyltransferase